MADMNWFMQNAPQMQPGGDGFQEQQPGAVPLPNTGMTGPPSQWNRSIGFGQVLPVTETERAAVPQMGPYPGALGGQMGALGPFTGLMQAGQFGGVGILDAMNLARHGMVPQGQRPADNMPEYFGNGQGMGGGAVNMGRGGQMMGNVLLRAPDGSTKSVPAGEMQHWLGRGAVRF